MNDQPRRERPPVLGAVVDDMTRCVHYRSPVDIVAIRFACCGEYYPCHLCHEEAAGHAARQWPLGARTEKAVLCGACGDELTIADYLAATVCPRCGAPFNERCALHAHLYFETEAESERQLVRSASAAASSAAALSEKYAHFPRCSRVTSPASASSFM